MSQNVNPKKRGRKKNRKTASPAKEPMELLGFEGSRHMIPERLPSARKERMVGVRVIDLNKSAYDGIMDSASTIKRIDLSELQLSKLQEDFIACLKELEKLDLAFNKLNDESFPNSFKKLEKLIELNLENNNITVLPPVLKRAKELKRLKLGYNKLATTEGLTKFKKLQILLLDGNQLESVPRDLYNQLKRLEILHMSKNHIKDIHIDVRYLRFLKDIDISGNKLTSLPSELLLLPRLEILNASNNQISRIPSFNVKGRGERKIERVDISNNVLLKFPEHLLSMTSKLDICKNRIKTIPGSSLKKLDISSGQELLMHDNPLVSPPLDICECGIRSIIQYFQEAKAEMKSYQGIKVSF
jgi:Leucine-rich repeat (LRR) protein